MIELRNISKSYRTLDGRRRTVLNDVNLAIPPNRSVGVLGRNGAGKSVMLRLISGLELPDRGQVLTHNRRVSWPLGTPAGVHGSLTGAENVRFVCKLYNKNYEEVLAFVESFAELKDYLKMPVKTYSAGMKSRLGFGISMAIEFDTYLIDEGFAAGDATFRKRAQEMFKARRDRANLVVVSHNPTTIANLCDTVAILRSGQIQIFEDVAEAIKIYQAL